MISDESALEIPSVDVQYFSADCIFDSVVRVTGLKDRSDFGYVEEEICRAVSAFPNRWRYQTTLSETAYDRLTNGSNFPLINSFVVVKPPEGIPDERHLFTEWRSHLHSTGRGHIATSYFRLRYNRRSQNRVSIVEERADFHIIPGFQHLFVQEDEVSE